MQTTSKSKIKNIQTIVKQTVVAMGATSGKRVYAKSVSGVRIPLTPPSNVLNITFKWFRCVALFGGYNLAQPFKKKTLLAQFRKIWHYLANFRVQEASGRI